MERLIHNAYQQLQLNSDCDLVGPQECQQAVASERRAFGCRVHPLPLFLISATVNSIRAANTQHYALCISGSGLTAPIALLIGTLFNIPVITFIHGLDLVVKNRIYQRIFVPAIRRCDKIIANSHNTALLAESVGIPTEKIEIIFPGVELHEKPTLADLANHSLPDLLNNRKILLAVGRLIPRKGLAEFIDHSLPEIILQSPDALLLIIGSEAENALNKESGILASIQQAIARNQLENHVILMGRVDEVTLSAAYHAAQLFIFPLRAVEGDVEGFGMVATEAAAHGLPTVAFSTGGVPDAIADGVSGSLVEPENYQALAQEVILYLSGERRAVTNATCRKHAEKFSWNNFGKQLDAVVQPLMNP